MFKKGEKGLDKHYIYIIPIQLLIITLLPNLGHVIRVQIRSKSSKKIKNRLGIQAKGIELVINMYRSFEVTLNILNSIWSECGF